MYQSTTLADIHPQIIQTHILPRLDGLSLFTLTTESPYLPVLSSDCNLWSHISKCTWPSITHQRVDELISAFPGGHRSFFLDAFPSLITPLNQRCNTKQPDCYPDSSTNPRPSKLISVVDVHYQTDAIYSSVQFTDITSEFLSSELIFKFNEDRSGSKPVIDLEVDEIAGVDETTLSHLNESLTLSWIVIDPTLKRAGNFSCTKPSAVKKDWTTNDIVLKYHTVLPGCDPNEMVKCTLKVVLGVGNHGKGLQVKEVTMELIDLDSYSLNGKDFLVIWQRAILMENNVVKKVVGDEERLQKHCEFKEMKKQRRKWVKKEEEKRKSAMIMNYVGMLVSFCFSVYFWSLKLQY